MASYKSRIQPPAKMEGQVHFSQRDSSNRLPYQSTISSPASHVLGPFNSKTLKKSSPEGNYEHAMMRKPLESGREIRSKAPPPHNYRPMNQRTASVERGILPASKTSNHPPSSHSVTRLPRSESVANPRTPSLVSGSTLSVAESSRSNRLKKKASSISTQSKGVRSASASSHFKSPKVTPPTFNDPFPEAVLGISLPPPSNTFSLHRTDRNGTSLHPTGYEAPSPILLEDLSPPTPFYATSVSPSTRYSESPGRFSHSSTPTSMSSHSPGLVQSYKMSQRPRQPSPLETKGLSSHTITDDMRDLKGRKDMSTIRESSASSSSASTVRAGGIGKNQDNIPAKLTSLPPGFSTSSVQTPVYPLPELAHLADDFPHHKAPLTQRPTRPSRNGTPEILSLREPSPVIQSNLTTAFNSTQHRRQSSTDSRHVTSPVSNGSRTYLPMPKSSSRNPSPSPSNFSSYPPTISCSPGTLSENDGKKGRVTPQLPSSPSKSSSRFGFFTRRNKADTAQPTVRATEKKSRKGPMAGTGYEGYGRYGIRGRSGSSTSGAGSVGRSASADSTLNSVNGTPSTRKSSIASRSEPDVDEFFRDRLTPVVLRGSGVGEFCASPDALQSGSSLSSSCDTSNAEKRMDSVTSDGDLSATDNPVLLPSLMADGDVSSTSYISKSSPKRIGLGLRRPSESDDEKRNPFRIPILASRRHSSRKSQLMEPPQHQHGANSGPIVTAPIQATVQMAKPLTQPKLTRKWNFFQRAQVPVKSEYSFIDPVDATRLPSSKSVAHYAMLDGLNTVDLKDLGEIMQEPSQSSTDVHNERSFQEDEVDTEFSSRRANPEYVQSILLPPPPSFPIYSQLQTRPESPKVQLQPLERKATDSFQDPKGDAQESGLFKFDVVPLNSAQSTIDSSDIDTPSVRPSRLPQIGRIPQVISKRDRTRKLSDKMFSRPFLPGQPRPSLQPNTSSAMSSDVSPTTALVSSPSGTVGGLQELSLDSHDNTAGEFFSFSARKNSEASCTSSCGLWNIQAPTAVIPAPGAPPLEDEIWKEYDDLLDEVLSPIEDYTKDRPFRAPTPGSELSCSGSEDELRPEPLTLKNLCDATGIEASAPGQTASFHLRRSRLLSILHASRTPTTASPVSDRFRRSCASVIDPTSRHTSIASNQRVSLEMHRSSLARTSGAMSSVASPRQSMAKVSGDIGNPSDNRYRDTKLMEMAEPQEEGLVSIANLRLGALMTSKWLSFGRVLFSPAHFDLKDSTEDRILIIDGLGKDWSYYCALTYPEASVYNLGPSPPDIASTGNTNTTPWSNVPNHCHVHHPNLSAPFPFPRGFFAAVVFRFPIATSEATYRAIIFECKRVLRPGGYLEISMLDLDLVNMGNRARRAIRNLKMQMQVADPNVSLGNVSDSIQKMLGKRGFENLNRCVVGVPAAGLATSEASTRTAASPHQSTDQKAKAKKLLFTELLSSSGNSNDADITDMVSRVGRWWHSQCYESLVISGIDMPNSIDSIWRDEALLRECEKWATSFRLLICYAQKPMVAQRRTVSL